MSEQGHCRWCPVAAGDPCRGDVLRRKCNNPAYRLLFASMVRGDVEDPGPPEWPEDFDPYASYGGESPLAQRQASAMASGPTNAELLANAEACPYRTPFPEDERRPCGCQWKCIAGRGPAKRKGGVLLTDCWDCPIAPRRSESSRDDANLP